LWSLTAGEYRSGGVESCSGETTRADPPLHRRHELAGIAACPVSEAKEFDVLDANSYTASYGGTPAYVASTGSTPAFVLNG